MAAIIEGGENKIYPNPVGDYLMVSHDVAENSELVILDISGREVLREKRSNGYEPVKTAHLMPGFYIVQINEGGEARYQQKVIKNSAIC